MSFMSQHYQCCPNSCGDATLAMQTAIVAAIAAVSTQIADIDTGGGGSGTATSTKQDEILTELTKLTSGLRTF